MPGSIGVDHRNSAIVAPPIPAPHTVLTSSRATPCAVAPGDVHAPCSLFSTLFVQPFPRLFLVANLGMRLNSM